MIAPALFVTTFLVEGWLSPGYDPVARYVSELSIGPRGWIQIANFIITGSLIIIFSIGLRSWLKQRNFPLAGATLLTIVGFCLFISGPLVTDPSRIFIGQMSTHGILHGIFGALVFTLSPASCFVFFFRFLKSKEWKWFCMQTLATALFFSAMVVMMKMGQMPSSPLNPYVGLIQKAALISFMPWLFTFALALYRKQDKRN